MKKNRTKIVSWLVVISMVVFLVLQVILIKNSYESEKKDFEGITRNLISSAFYRLNINANTLHSVTEKLLQMKSSTLLEQSDFITEGLTMSLDDYGNFGSIIEEIFRENGIKAEYEYAVAVGKYIIYDEQNRKQEIIPDFQKKEKMVSFGTLNEFRQLRAYNVFYYKGANFFVEINSYIKYKNITLYLIGRILGTIMLSFIATLIVFSAFIYTLIVIKKQRLLTEMKSDFINNITHEFNTPLNTIKVAGANLKNQDIKSDPEMIDHLAGVIIRQNTRLQKLIDDVMHASVMEEEKPHLNYSEVDISELIKSIAEDIQMNYSEKSINCKVECPAEIILKCDELQISTAFHNVMDNAAKYSPAGSEINITIAGDEKTVRISVEDEGPGIDPNELNAVFEKFYRAKSARLTQVKGLGLGLYFVKKIIIAHSGTIEARKGTVKGSIFKITLPKMR